MNRSSCNHWLHVYVLVMWLLLLISFSFPLVVASVLQSFKLKFISNVHFISMLSIPILFSFKSFRSTQVFLHLFTSPLWVTFWGSCRACRVPPTWFEYFFNSGFIGKTFCCFWIWFGSGECFNLNDSKGNEHKWIEMTANERNGKKMKG